AEARGLEAGVARAELLVLDDEEGAPDELLGGRVVADDRDALDHDLGAEVGVAELLLAGVGLGRLLRARGGREEQEQRQRGLHRCSGGSLRRGGPPPPPPPPPRPPPRPPRAP